MPIGEAVGELFLRVIWEGILRFICYMTGVVLIAVFTFGQFGVREMGSRRKPSRKKKHRREISDDVATIVGLLFWVSAIVIAIVF